MQAGTPKHRCSHLGADDESKASVCPLKTASSRTTPQLGWTRQERATLCDNISAGREGTLGRVRACLLSASAASRAGARGAATPTTLHGRAPEKRALV
jgi:hypothetical protein